MTEHLLVGFQVGTRMNPVDAHRYEKDSKEYEDGLS